LSRPEKPEKRKPGKPQPETSSGELLGPRLERRWRVAKPEKSQPASKSVLLKEMIETAKNAKHQFTLAAVEIIEYAHFEKSRGKDEAIKLAQLVAKEIAAQLREGDLVAPHDQGLYFIYLPDTQKQESTVVMERLTRQISRQNQRRPILPQLSLSFRLLAPETIIRDQYLQLADPEKKRLSDWLSRYFFTGDNLEAACQPAQDMWAGSRQVLIKRLNFQNLPARNKIESLRETLSSIQETGMALFPQLFDFHLGNNFVYLVVEPSSPYLEAQPSTLKSAHSLSISVCDLFLQLASLSPPMMPPPAAEIEFRKTDINHEPVAVSLDEYLVVTVIEEPEQATSKLLRESLESLDSFSKLLKRISEKFPADQCFSEAFAQLKNEKEIKSPIQKIRAILKRHEEKLRREQLSAAEGNA